MCLVVVIWSGLLAYMVLALAGFGFIVALFLLLVIAAARNWLGKVHFAFWCFFLLILWMVFFVYLERVRDGTETWTWNSKEPNFDCISKGLHANVFIIVCVCVCVCEMEKATYPFKMIKKLAYILCDLRHMPQIDLSVNLGLAWSMNFHSSFSYS